MNSCEIFYSAFGAAIGGFIGVIIFYLVRLFIEWRQTRPSVVRIYLCGNDLNQGQDPESDGELKHNHGKRISNENDYRKLGVKNPIWEWTRTPAGGSGASVIYGPYSTDFAEPGLYSAIFSIRGIGLTKPTEIIKDLPLLELDVLKTIWSEGVQNKVARKFIRISDLAPGGWRDFELRFYSDGQGLWEYRVLAYDGLDGKPDHIANLGTEVRILFDKITIRNIKKFQLPPA